MRNLLHCTGVALIVLGLSACAKPADSNSADTAANDGADTAAMPSGGDAGAAGAAEPAAAAAGVISVSWSCDGKPVTSDFDNAKRQVSLKLGNDVLTLPEAESGSGARYADKAGNEFWEHQGEATLTLAGGKEMKCSKAPGA